MTDKREQILSAIFEVLEGIPGVAACVRNRDQLPAADKLPAIMMMDGDEEGKRDADGRGRSAVSPNRVILKPEIYVILQVSKPRNEGVGPSLNAFRALVLKALLTSTAITDLCESVFYAGCITDLAQNRKMEGQFGLSIEFTYLLRPNDL